MDGSLLARPTDEDPLTYLPRRSVQEFARGRVIYDLHRPTQHLYVTIAGRVKVSTTSDSGAQTVCRIVCPDGLFGESCLVNARSGSAVALDNATVMAWSRAEIEQQIEREARLGIALAQYLVRQCNELQERIESMALHKTPQRVMLALVQLAENLGSPMADGSLRVASLTHRTIADYVGTSREIVTYQMNRLRREGLLRYTRKFIDIWPQAIVEAIRQEGVTSPSSSVSCTPAAV